MAVLTGKAKLRRIEQGRELQAAMLKEELSYDCLLYTSPSPRDS